MNIKRLDDPTVPLANTMVGLILYGMQGGTTVRVLPSLFEPSAPVDGVNGRSAYDVAIANGFVGTQAEWLESLRGAAGSKIIGVSIEGDDIVYHLDVGEDITLSNGRVLLRGEQGVSVSSAAFVDNDLVFTLSDNSSATVVNAKSILKGDPFTYEDFTPEQIEDLIGDVNAYINTISEGFLSNYIGFEIDEDMNLVMSTPDNYNGAEFILENGELKVVI